MSTHPVGQHEPGLYEIRLEGRLHERWSAWFGGMTLTVHTDPTGPMTILRGQVADQAALHGLLARLRDCGVPIISITRVDPVADDDHLRDHPTSRTDQE